MKHVITLFLCLSAVLRVQAQSSAKIHSLSIAYFSQWVVQPGIKAGITIPVKKVASDFFYVSPQAGAFFRPGNDRNLLVNADFGYRTAGKKPNSYSSVSVGLGFWSQSQQISSVAELGGSGSILKKTWEGYPSFLPSLNYEYGRQINSSLFWYLKPSFGARLQANEPPVLAMFLDLGLTFSFEEE